MLSARHEHATAAKPGKRVGAKNITETGTLVVLGICSFLGRWAFVIGTLSFHSPFDFESQI
jgi:hypothetical protein